MQLTIVDNVTSLQQALVGAAKEGKRVALVPTMGALHAGHMSLVAAAKTLADYVVVSIFVNPTQFGPNEDYEKYPRALQEDLKKLEAAGASLAYTPSVQDVYPPGFLTTVSVGDMGNVLCGKFRPGHFDGVATVVTKLLLRVLPHVALFGEKDYQQLCIIRQVVVDLDMPMEIIGVPTLREADGLAMSSRNAYLSLEERKIAPSLHNILEETKKSLNEGLDVTTSLALANTKLAAAGFKVDYVDLVAGETLFQLSEIRPGCRLIAAAWLGKTRLIDNIVV